mmetsp:Transcript_5254/g.14909  ORF Transcript_5254/g.14909 Transcript_5254/m.14909 type:complete len:552 (-) Transcript_5254:31-1686(-)
MRRKVATSFSRCWSFQTRGQHDLGARKVVPCPSTTLTSFRRIVIGMLPPAQHSSSTITFHPRYRPFSTSDPPAPALSISDVIKNKIDSGELVHDHAQQRAAERLARLQLTLDGYDNTAASNAVDEEAAARTRARKAAADVEADESDDKKQGDTATTDEHKTQNGEDSSDQSDASSATKERIVVPRGMFLHGAVGTGKSMLMDTFYEHAPVNRKRRVHFHSFMADVHSRIHKLKQRDLALYGRSFAVDTSEERNPIRRVATELAAEVSLLCFDEFQVYDVADALILSQLFGEMWRRGLVVVATSNRPPRDLYEGGINRGYFLPFIAMLRRHCIVHEFKSSTDYRRLLSDGIDEYFFVADDGDFDGGGAKVKCDEIFRELLGGTEATSIELDVAFNRSISVKQAHPDGIIGRFTFEELCNVELGASDYRSIAQEFQFIIIEEIPMLTLKEHDQARRFITLIDELYEAECALICSAVAAPDELFHGREGVAVKKDTPESIETKVGEMFGIDVAQSSGKTVGELASVRELAFAFERAASRLTEMCSSRQFAKNLS